jgi:DNA replication regulator SLD3
MALIHPLLRDASEAPSAGISNDNDRLGASTWVIEGENGGETQLAPLYQISRAQVSLSWIDYSQPSQFFSLPSRYLGGRFHSLLSGSTWLAQDLQTKYLGVVEKSTHGVYTLTRLSSNLSQSDLAADVGDSREWDGKLSGWWQQAKLEQDEIEPNRSRKRIKLDMSRPTPQTQPASGPQPIASPIVGAVQNQEGQQSHEPMGCDQLFENFVCQYLDALYLSRTSLAFFAKGPLSRVRALFSTPAAENINIIELAVFLRSMIIPLNALDKKFREKMPYLAEEFALKQLNDDESNEKRKSRKKKKLKINREGMYPFEEEYVGNWWKADDEIGDNETRDGKIKRRVGDLRVRQTLIQIILLLEVMAVEASSAWKQMKETQKDESNQPDKETPKRSKKPIDLDLTLDLLVDNLSLWQSIEVDSRRHIPGSEKSKNWSKDVLGSFCVDVLVPFFKTRVPSKAAQIIKRFGGPNTSPEKSKVVKKAKESKDDATKRDSRKLSRSTSNAQVKPLRPGHLSRSISDLSSIVPGLKREGSEARSISSIPVIPEKPKPRRDSMASLKHLKSRQISLSSLKAPADRKRKREVKVDDELQSAIDGIKKPNRSMIGRQVVDEREKMKSFTITRNVKPTKLMSNDRKALGAMENVQILATPHHKRTKHLCPNASQLKMQMDEPDVVTSSAIKPQSRELIPATDLKQISEGSARQHILETPSKGIRQYMLQSSPVNMGGTFNTRRQAPPEDVYFPSSPVIPASTRPVKTFPKFAFGRPMPAEEQPLTSPSKSRLLAVPATPIKKS